MEITWCAPAAITGHMMSHARVAGSSSWVTKRVMGLSLSHGAPPGSTGSNNGFRANSNDSKFLN